MSLAHSPSSDGPRLPRRRRRRRAACPVERCDAASGWDAAGAASARPERMSEEQRRADGVSPLIPCGWQPRIGSLRTPLAIVLDSYGVQASARISPNSRSSFSHIIPASVER